MTIYLVLVGALVAESAFFFDSERFKKGQKFIFIVMVLLLGFIAGARSLDVGHDTLTYYGIFKDISKYEFGTLFAPNKYSEMEQGYVWFCWLFSRISNNFSHFLLITSLFEYSAVGYWVWKNSKRPFLSLTIFTCMFYTFFLTGIRQSIALAILLLAYENVKKKQLIRFAIKVLIAFMFHQTALIFLVVYILSVVIKTGRKFFIGSLIALPVLYLTRNNIFFFLIDFFERYSDYEILEHGEATTYTLLLLFIAFVSVIFKGLFPSNEDQDKEYNYFTCLIIVALLIMPFVGLNGAIMRVAMYFSIFLCLLMVQLYDRINEPGFKFIVVGLTIVLLIALFTNELNGSAYLYEFIGWDKIFA
ncbi:MAG: EpsG family protein [Clostridia bacterium]|nr:EpsG family protein [Clostridia bacterium]